ncbi:MAG: phosphate ABC transporter permease PstA [Armatimonadota bacterium]|nr:phosphate ABC transporter permease PstA [Armatimonadota bacterium]
MASTAGHNNLKDKHHARRKFVENVFLFVCISATLIGFLSLVLLIVGIAKDGASVLSWDFLNNFPSRKAERAGVKAALYGTFWLMGLTALFSIPLGVGAAIYLEEFAKKNWLTKIIQINIANLAGVPSIVYGLLGLAVFVRALSGVTDGSVFGIDGTSRSVISGALTMSLLILPMIITSTQEALKAVPQSYREGALALGSTTWETVRNHVLPPAMPGVLTSIILGLSRAIGESAPLMTIGALTYVAFVPKTPFDGFTVMPIQIFQWASRPQDAFHKNAAGAILVLMAVLIIFNAAAIYLRQVARRRLM